MANIQIKANVYLNLSNVKTIEVKRSPKYRRRGNELYADLASKESRLDGESLSYHIEMLDNSKITVSDPFATEATETLISEGFIPRE